MAYIGPYANESYLSLAASTGLILSLLWSPVQATPLLASKRVTRPDHLQCVRTLRSKMHFPIALLSPWWFTRSWASIAHIQIHTAQQFESSSSAASSGSLTVLSLAHHGEQLYPTCWRDQASWDFGSTNNQGWKFVRRPMCDWKVYLTRPIGFTQSYFTFQYFIFLTLSVGRKKQRQTIDNIWLI